MHDEYRVPSAPTSQGSMIAFIVFGLVVAVLLIWWSVAAGDNTPAVPWDIEDRNCQMVEEATFQPPSVTKEIYGRTYTIHPETYTRRLWLCADGSSWNTRVDP